ncbi:aspartate/glutamate racemase family protein [Dyella acidiphila]|uniref:Aspartate/glutamate racemase family protein n=1 Tax=Dyella acidiphila TaxID=2775866 RepID=A0ABR9GDB5_9GAMM|nr:aspartate/glutamate racemase family protein [Dyella acidiphila]MBE1162041.1 aspartate/glutamate racemase family protein [Dyella acidiphila]
MRIFTDHAAVQGAVAEAEARMAAVAAAHARRGIPCTDQVFDDEIWLLAPPQASAPALLLIGGMGPQAGLRAFAQTCARFAQSRRIVLLQACSIPDRSQAVRAGLAGEIAGMRARQSVVQALTGAVQHVRELAQTASADLIVLCNTAHHFLGHVPLPPRTRLIDLVDAAAQHCRGMASAIVLSTYGTRVSGLYLRSLAQQHVHCLTPPAEMEALLADLVYRGIKAMNPDYAVAMLPVLLQQLAQWAPHADGLICGCTEIPLLLGAAHDVHAPWPLIDPLSCALACLEEDAGATAAHPLPLGEEMGHAMHYRS